MGPGKEELLYWGWLESAGCTGLEILVALISGDAGFGNCMVSIISQPNPKMPVFISLRLLY